MDRLSRLKIIRNIKKNILFAPSVLKFHNDILLVDPNIFGMWDKFRGRQFFSGSGRGHNSSALHLLCTVFLFKFLVNATADLTGGTGPWPGGWRPLL